MQSRIKMHAFVDVTNVYTLFFCRRTYHDMQEELQCDIWTQNSTRVTHLQMSDLRSAWSVILWRHLIRVNTANDRFDPTVSVVSSNVWPRGILKVCVCACVCLLGSCPSPRYSQHYPACQQDISKADKVQSKHGLLYQQSTCLRRNDCPSFTPAPQFWNVSFFSPTSLNVQMHRNIPARHLQFWLQLCPPFLL